MMPTVTCERSWTMQQLVFIYPIKVNTEARDIILGCLFEKANIWLLLKGITQ